MRSTTILGTLLAIVIVAGCGRPPQIRPDPYQQPIADLSAYNALWVVVEGSDQVAKAYGLDITLAELRRQFIEELNKHGKFAVREARPAQGKAAQVRLTITGLHYVSGAARGLAVLSGSTPRAILVVNMLVTDPDAGSVLGRLTASQIERGVPTNNVTSVQISETAKDLAARLAAASTR